MCSTHEIQIEWALLWELKNANTLQRGRKQLNNKNYNRATTTSIPNISTLNSTACVCMRHGETKREKKKYMHVIKLRLEHCPKSSKSTAFENARIRHFIVGTIWPKNAYNKRHWSEIMNCILYVFVCVCVFFCFHLRSSIEMFCNNVGSGQINVIPHTSSYTSCSALVSDEEQNRNMNSERETRYRVVIR